MRKLLVTGSSGFLGSNVAWFARDRYEVVATSLHQIELEDYLVEKLDVTDREACFHTVRKHEPDVVVHCSALTPFIANEEGPKLAEEINVKGTRNLADACRDADAKMILISTDYVFDGKNNLGKKYSEEDQSLPVNHYGHTKMRAENELRTSGAKWIVTRPSNIFGNCFAIPRDRSLRADHAKKHGGWAASVISALKEGKSISAATNQYQTPILATKIAEVVLKLHETAHQGIFHVAGTTCISRYDFAMEIARVFELDASLIKREDRLALAASYGVRGLELPQNTCLDVSKVERTLGIRMPTVSEGLEMMKEQLGHYPFCKD